MIIDIINIDDSKIKEDRHVYTDNNNNTSM